MDGVISLFGSPTGGPADETIRRSPGTIGSPGDPIGPPPGTWVTVDGIVHFLSEQAGRHLLVLAEHFELVWCSGWEEKANEYLPRALGIPGPLPYLTFGPDGLATNGRRAVGAKGPEAAHDARPPAVKGGDAGPGGAVRRHWKLDAIDAWAGTDRPLAWLDDAFDDGCREWAAQRPGPTLLVPTEPARGLTRVEAGTLLAWVAA